MKTEVRNITPAIAQNLLKKNTHNRSISQKKVDEYATDIRTGNWKETGDSIKIATGGVLLDGQHRLMGVVQAGVAVEMLVVSGLDREIFPYLDGHMPRGAKVPLEIAKVPHFQRVASALAVVEAYDKGIKKRPRVHVRTCDVLDILAKHPDIPEALEAIGGARVSLISRSLFDGLFYIFYRIDKEMAEEYMVALRDGRNIDLLDCWHSLRERLIKNLTHQQHKLEEGHMAALVIKGWNYARRGKDCSRLLYTPGKEDFPVAI